MRNCSQKKRRRGEARGVTAFRQARTLASKLALGEPWSADGNEREAEEAARLEASKLAWACAAPGNWPDRWNDGKTRYSIRLGPSTR